MIDPATTAAALKSAEANTAAIVRRAKFAAGTPMEHELQILAEAAQRTTNNLRAIHEATERRTA